MCAYLALHRSQPDDIACLHSAYVELLPTEDDFRTPLWFTAAEFALLQRTNVYGATMQRHRDWRAEHEQLDPSLKISWLNYLWAATILSSRAFSSRLITGIGEATPVLFPGVDSLNHRRGEKVGWLSGEDALSLVTDADVSAGVELFNNYGPKSNEEWLLGYGFAIKDNVDDVLVLRLPNSPEWHMIKRDGQVPPALYDEIKTKLGDEEEDETQTKLNVLDQLGEMLQAKMAALQAPTEQVEGPVREEVRQAIEWYRQGACVLWQS